jgi:uncharacterized phage protein (TIGR01671 family)
MTPKFRAWIKTEKCFDDYIESIRFYINEIDLCWGGICESDCFDFNDVILMQSTGLVDKNGKEIFEGDILCDEGIEQESEFVYVTVSYREGMWVCDQITDELCGYGGALNEFNNDYSIIGNIYENPELLEDK